MVSYQIALEALTTLINKSLQSFHQVLHHPESYGDEDAEVLLYMALAKDELLMCDIDGVESALASKRASSARGTEVAHKTVFPTRRIEYSAVQQILVDAQHEDRFSIVLEPAAVGLSGEELLFSSCYRKEVVSALQVLINTNVTQTSNALKTVSVKFTGVDNSDPRLAFRHPAVKMFALLPAHVQKGMKVFYRRGYMFLLPRHVVDRYELMDNRPCSTYIFRPLDPRAKKLDVKPSHTKHLIARFLPERPCHTDRPESELAFQLWTESIAYAVAEKEFQDNQTDRPNSMEYNDSYFVPEREVYRKKMNVVGDQASWSCFRVMIYTKHRQIGVIGVRRKFLPPLLDTYQDMVFVLYGAYKQNGDDIVKSDFMDELELLVDTLSPAAAALQTRSMANLFAAKKQGKDSAHVHRTYFDKNVIQARANALFYSRDSYSWLKFQKSIDVVPKTKFIDLECDRLAAIFCKSVLDLFPKVGQGKKRESKNLVQSEQKLEDRDPFEENRKAREDDDSDAYDSVPDPDASPVSDPLSIIFRMQSQVQDDSPDLEDGDTAEYDWNRRIARYFAFCIDGGWSKQHLTIKKLTKVTTLADHDDKKSGQIDKALMLSPESRKIIDKVIEFLLCIIPDGEFEYKRADNLVAKLRSCFNEDHSARGFSCNDWAMTRILETTYIDKHLLQSKDANKDDDVEDRVSESAIFVHLLKTLLSKSYDLELIKAVCVKIVRLMSGGISSVAVEDGAKRGEITALGFDVPPLLAPLIEHVRTGNTYAKLYCIQALNALARQDGGEMIFRRPEDPLALAVQLLKHTKSPPLLEATLRFIVTLYPAMLKFSDKNLLAEDAVVAQLVNMLGSRYTTPVRHQPEVLGEVATLLVNLTAEESAREVMLSQEHSAVQKLMFIVRDHANYNDQLEVFTKCLTNLFIQGKDHQEMFLGGVVADNAKVYCEILAETLSACATKSKIRVCLYILSVMRQLLRTDVTDKKYNEASDKKYRQDSQTRFHHLEYITQGSIAFDRILTTVMAACTQWVQEKIEVDMDNFVGDEEEKRRAQKQNELHEQKMRTRDASMLQGIVLWFKDIIRAANAHKWVYKRYQKYQQNRQSSGASNAQGPEDMMDAVSLDDAASSLGD